VTAGGLESVLTSSQTVDMSRQRGTTELLWRPRPVECWDEKYVNPTHGL